MAVEAPPGAGMVAVEVVAAWPGRHVARTVRLPVGATVADALAAAELPPAVMGEVRGHAIHGIAVAPGARLRDGDRLELLRPLRADPKEARRRRAGTGGG